MQIGASLALHVLGDVRLKKTTRDGLGLTRNGIAVRHPEKRFSGLVGRAAGCSLLLVLCAWRIDSRRVPLASSDSKIATGKKAASRLAGKIIRRIEIGSSWDLRIDMTDGLALTVFPDHVGPAASVDANWELWRLGVSYVIGNDLTCEVLGKDNCEMQLKPPFQRWQERTRVPV